jgi:hypothetical protein
MPGANAPANPNGLQHRAGDAGHDLESAVQWIVVLWGSAGRHALLAAHGRRSVVGAPPATPGVACEDRATHGQAACRSCWSGKLGLRRTTCAVRLFDRRRRQPAGGRLVAADGVAAPRRIVARMPAGLLEALLAHELAHIRRHDYLVNLLQAVVEALLFYHPVVWWLSRRIRHERELIADDLAADALGDRRSLALALSELDRMLGATAAGPIPRFAHAAHGGQLMSRIQHLLRPRQHPLAIGLSLPLLGLALAGAAMYAHAQSTAPATAPTVDHTDTRHPPPPPRPRRHHLPRLHCPRRLRCPHRRPRRRRAPIGSRNCMRAWTPRTATPWCARAIPASA